MPEWNGMVKDLQGAFGSIQQEERMVKRIWELTSRQGVDLNNLKTEFGVLPALHLACHTGNPVGVRVLLKKFDAGSDILKKAGDDKDTAFHWAAESGSTPVLQILLDEHRQMVRSKLVDLGSKVKVLEVENLYNRTPLHSAMENGRVEAAGFLIRSGANVHAQDRNGYKMIHFAAKSGSVEALELVKEVTSPNVDVNATSRYNYTPLHWAAANGRVAAVDWLLRNGADLTVADSLLGGLPLHYAAKHLHIDVVEKLLCKEGSDPLVTDKEGKTVLDLVCEGDASSGKLQLQKLLEKMQDLKGIFLSNHMVEYVARYGSSATCKWLEARLTAEYVLDDGKELVKKVKLLDFAAESDNVDAVPHLLHLIGTLLEDKNKTDHQDQDKVLLDQLSSAVQTALLKGNLAFAVALALGLRDTERVHLGTWVKELKDKFVGEISQELKDLWEDLQQSRVVDMHSGKLWGLGKKRYQGKQEDLGMQLPFAFILTWMRTMRAKKSLVEATTEFIKQENLWGEIGFLNPPSKRNALHWAVLLAKPQVVDELLKIHGCETEAVAEDDNERTPHELAVTAHRLFTLAADRDSVDEKDKRKLEKLADVAKKLESIKIKLQVESQTVKDLNDVLHRDRTLSVEALNAILVGSALLAGITFQGVLQKPDTNNKTGVNIFAAFNSLSFFFGMASAIIGATGVLPKSHEYIGHLLNDISSKLQLAAVLLIISIACVLVAFASAGFATIHPSFRYALLITIGIGGGLCVYVLALFIRRIYRLWWFTEQEKDTAMHKVLAHKFSFRSTVAHEPKGWSIC